MRFFLTFIFGGFFISSLALAKDFIQTGTSVSHFYGARSVFINPAALAFENELNGTHFQSSFSWGSGFKQDDLALGLSWGGLGFGVDRSNTNAESRTRYSLVSSLALGPWIFLGNRLGIHSDAGTSPGFTQWDLGLQIRPSPYFSIGAQANRIGRDSLYTFGVALKPLKPLILWADFETRHQGFGQDWNYQSTLSLEILRGLFFQGGYDKTEKIHLGFQWDLGKASLFGIGRSEGGEKAFVSHVQFHPSEKANFLQSEKTLEVSLDSNLKESVEASTLLSSGKLSFSELLFKIQTASRKPEVKSIFVEIKYFPLGLSAALEMFQALWEARKSGKLVHVSLENARLKEYLIASAGHQISMVPSSSIEWAGPKSERYYLKGTLDKVGIEAEIIAKGSYKSAPETFNRKSASEKSRENIEQNLKEAEEEIKAALQITGRANETVWKKATQLGLLSAQEALELKLVDKIQPIETAKKHSSGSFVASQLEENRTDFALPPEIALIVASGDIVREKVRLLGLFGSEQITPDTLSYQLEKAKNDKRIRAIILRVSSGGGDVLSSHLIATQVEELRKTKPVIVSMGDVAASGGYFISVPASGVVASPLTLTGSIGVFTGKPNLNGLFKKMDLKKEIFTFSPYPNLFNEAEEWSQAERRIIEKQVSHYYQTFISYVASHRSISIEKVENAAQGRVWWGRKALSLNLVDDIGGMARAFQLAQEKAGIRNFALRVIYPQTGFFNALSETVFMKEPLQLYGALKPYLLSDKPFLFWWDQNIH